MKNQSTEDYIKNIYKLQQDNKSVSTSELAKYLEIGDGSVTGMLKKLSAKKLIQYKPYKGVSLTESGRRLALKMVRRHRLWEMFLVQYLGYTWDEIHSEAEKLEHVTSEEMDRRLDKALGHPKVDPHGDPIPDVNGDIEDSWSTALTEFDSGETLKIIRVSDENPDLLQHATALGLNLDKTIVVKKKMKFDGSMVIKVGKRERFISQRVAKAIFVRLV